MSNSVFIIFYDKYPLVVLTETPTIWPRDAILDWYAKEYAFERSKLSGYFCESICGKDKSYSNLSE